MSAQPHRPAVVYRSEYLIKLSFQRSKNQGPECQVFTLKCRFCDMPRREFIRGSFAEHLRHECEGQ